MFADRREAGRMLGERLLEMRNQGRMTAAPLVLALPRGGVVVGAEAARILDARLDVLIVRKLGAPHQPELAIGAVTDGEHPQHILNDDLIEALGVDQAYL